MLVYVGPKHNVKLCVMFTYQTRYRTFHRKRIGALDLTEMSQKTVPSLVCIVRYMFCII